MENKEYIKECPICGKEITFSRKNALVASIRDNKMCKSCSLRKRYSDPKEREKASIVHKKSYSDDPSIKEKISVACIKRFFDPKEREKTSRISKKIWADLELRKKASDKSIKFYSNPEEVKKMGAAVKIALNNPDIKKKHRDAIKIAMRRPDVRKRHIEALTKVNYLGRAMDVGFIEMIKCWNKMGFHFQSNYQIHTDTDLFYVDGYDKEKNVVLEYDSKYHNNFTQKQKDLIRQQKIIDILKPKKFWRYDSVNKTCKNVLEE